MFRVLRLVRVDMDCALADRIDLAATSRSYLLDQERICRTLGANRRERAMTGNHDNLVRKRQELAPNGLDDFGERAAPQIRAPNAAGKKRIAGQHGWDILIHNEAYTAWRVSGRMHHLKR